MSYRPTSNTKTRKAPFDVCHRRQLQIAPGDKLLLQANRREARLLNGQIVEVKSVEEATGAITLTDGRTLPPDYRTFCHGYAVTSHSSQSKTVDEIIMVTSSRSLGAVDREQFYVSISRGRQRCRILTDDKLLLRERIVRSACRKAALELSGLENALRQHGFTPKLTDKEESPGLSPSPLAIRHDLRNPCPNHRIRPLRPIRAARLSRLNRFAQAVIAWVAHLKLTQITTRSITPSTSQRIGPALRPGVHQHPRTQRQSNHISI